jgi:ABC-type sugar transport system permease subunit
MGYAAALSWILFAVIALFTLVQFRLMREERS